MESKIHSNIEFEDGLLLKSVVIHTKHLKVNPLKKSLQKSAIESFYSVSISEEQPEVTKWQPKPITITT
jgi:hypothetical protein